MGRMSVFCRRESENKIQNRDNIILPWNECIFQGRICSEYDLMPMLTRQRAKPVRQSVFGPSEYSVWRAGSVFGRDGRGESGLSYLPQDHRQRQRPGEEAADETRPAVARRPSLRLATRSRTDNSGAPGNGFGTMSRFSAKLSAARWLRSYRRRDRNS
jgi:hypothetical protein